MSKDAKYELFSRMNPEDMENKIIYILRNKFYNLWMNKFEWTGLDEEVKEQQQSYIMRQFWTQGKVAGRHVKSIDMMVYADFAINKVGLYDFPELVDLINKRDVSKTLIPDKTQVVGKDVAVLYCQPNRRPILDIVNYYIKRMAQVELIINTNLCLQKMPYLIGVDEKDKAQMEDIVNRILNDEVVVFTGIGDLQKLQAVVTQAPYIVDKLRTYEISLENELLTFLGIDNSGSGQKAAQLTVDEVNATNDSINEYGYSIEDEINRWLDVLNRTFGKNIHIKSRTIAVDSIYDQEVRGRQPEKPQEEEETANDN